MQLRDINCVSIIGSQNVNNENIQKTIEWSIKIVKLVCKMHLRKSTYGLLITVKKNQLK